MTITSATSSLPVWDVAIWDGQLLVTTINTAITSTTYPVGPNFVPAAATNTASYFDMTIEEKVLPRLDYRGVLASTTGPVVVIVPPAAFVTPSIFFHPVRQPNPSGRDYRATIEATTHATQRFPVTLSCGQWDSALWDIGRWCGTGTPITFWDSPRPPLPAVANYTRVLESTTHPVGQLKGAFAAVFTPSTWFNPPTSPLPGMRNYRPTLDSTTYPVGQLVGTPVIVATTPSNWFDPPTSAMPARFLQASPFTALASTSGVAQVLELIAPPPVIPPPPHICVVPFGDNITGLTVTFGPGSAIATVTLTSGVTGQVALTPVAEPSKTNLNPTAPGATKPLDPNEGCP